jgi:hypothetical protein
MAGFQINQMSGSEWTTVPTLLTGAGIWITPSAAIEGSVSWSGGQSTPWHYAYFFGGEASDQETTDRDVPLVASFRYALFVRRRVGLDILAGGGYSAHRVVSTTVADCGPANRPQVCVPLATPSVSDSQTSWEPLVSFGMDIPAMMAEHVAFVPGVRFMYIRRDAYPTDYSFRGPQSGSGYLFLFTATVSWRDR